MTWPEAARVETSLPASKTGRAFWMSVGSSPASRRSRSCLRSGFAAAQASKDSCHSARMPAARSARPRVWAMTSSATTNVSAASKPRTFVVAASSSAPSAEPWILPEFCLPGDGQPMIVLRMMSEGLEVSPFAASMAAFSSATSSTYSPVFFQSTVCTCQP